MVRDPKTLVPSLLDDYLDGYPRRKRKREEAFRVHGLEVEDELRIDPPEPLQPIPTFDPGVTRPLSPMLRDRFEYAGTIVYSSDVWLAPGSMREWLANPDRLRYHRGMRKDQDDSAPMLFEDDRLALLRVTPSRIQNADYLVWLEDDGEPQVWSYFGTDNMRFFNLEEYLKYCLGRVCTILHALPKGIVTRPRPAADPDDEEVAWEPGPVPGATTRVPDLLLEIFRAPPPPCDPMIEAELDENGIPVDYEVNCDPPEDVKEIPTFDLKTARPLSPMLRDRFATAGSIGRSEKGWITPSEMWNSYYDDDELREHHERRRREWAGSAPMRFGDDRLALFGITPGLPECVEYLVWVDDDAEPEIWGYSPRESYRFPNLVAYLEWCLGRG